MICQDCIEPVTPNQVLLESLAKNQTIPANAEFFHGRGCKKCLGTGYAGRFGVFEVLSISQTIAEAIERGAAMHELRDLAIEEGMVELSIGGFRAALEGRTTIEEAFYKTAT